MAVRHAPRNRLSVQVTAHPDRWSHKQNSAYGLLNSKTVFALNGGYRFLVLVFCSFECFYAFRTRLLPPRSQPLLLNKSKTYVSL